MAFFVFLIVGCGLMSLPFLVGGAGFYGAQELAHNGHPALGVVVLVAGVLGFQATLCLVIEAFDDSNDGWGP